MKKIERKLDKLFEMYVDAFHKAWLKKYLPPIEIVGGLPKEIKMKRKIKL
jgi:hypothetical protein